MQTPIILSDTKYDKWLNSLELVLPFGDVWPYYRHGLKWLINYLTHAPKKLGHHDVFHMTFPHVCKIHTEYLIFTCQCRILWAMQIDEVSYCCRRRQTSLFMQTGDCHHSSDYWAQDGIWRELISGVISYLKANEFPDNKMVGRSQGLVIGKLNHVFSAKPSSHRLWW